jgi:hypothetical protein
VVADSSECLIPGRQDFTGGRIEVDRGVLVPGREVAAVEAHCLGGRPPHLVICRGEYPAQLGARDGAADRDVDVEGEPFLGFDSGEVLEVIAAVPAQVLDEPGE